MVIKVNLMSFSVWVDVRRLCFRLGRRSWQSEAVVVVTYSTSLWRRSRRRGCFDFQYFQCLTRVRLSNLSLSRPRLLTTPRHRWQWRVRDAGTCSWYNDTTWSSWGAAPPKISTAHSRSSQWAAAANPRCQSLYAPTKRQVLWESSLWKRWKSCSLVSFRRLDGGGSNAECKSVELWLKSPVQHRSTELRLGLTAG